MTPIQKILLEIKEQGSFDRLEAFRSSKVWTQMTQAERDLFSLLLLKEGAQQLAKGDSRVLENFELAKRVSSDAVSTLYQQGMIFASYPESGRCLELAVQCFAEAIKQDSTSYLGWYRWAQVCVAQGLLHTEISYFLEADAKFKRAAELWDDSECEVVKGTVYWEWGNCLASLGRSSGEPVDLYQAIDYYRTAQALGCQEGEFFDSYGCVLLDLASLLERQEIFLEASKFFELSIEKNPHLIVSWINYATCFIELSELTFREEYFEQAASIFEQAVAIDPSSSDLWYKWAKLEARLGRLKRNRKILEESLEKFSKAYELDSENADILSSWAEIELFLGSYQERLDLIQSAKLRVVKALEIYPENADSWYIYGSCLNELGYYFEEEDFYYKAIEKFNYGLSLVYQHPLLWYGLALSNLAIAEANEDVAFLEKAVRCCSRVIECEGEPFPQFWNDWGVALMKLGEITEDHSYVQMAIDKFEKAFKRPLESEYEDVDLDWIYNYGCAFDLLGDLTEEPCHFEKSIAILSQVVQLDPYYLPARYNLALAFSHFGEVSFDAEPYYKAVEQFQVLLEQDPEDELIYLDFGVSLINLALLVHDIHHPERAQNLYRQAESLLMHAASLGNCQAFYQLAGLYSLTGQYSLAMHYIERSQFFGMLPSLDDLMHDEWLDGLRQTQPFRNFLSQLSSQQSKED